MTTKITRMSSRCVGDGVDDVEVAAAEAIEGLTDFRMICQRAKRREARIHLWPLRVSETCQLG